MTPPVSVRTTAWIRLSCDGTVKSDCINTTSCVDGCEQLRLNAAAASAAEYLISFMCGHSPMITPDVPP